MIKRDGRSFGPAVRVKDGTLIPECTYCIFRTGDSCTHVKPAMKLPPGSTPDWCEMLEDMMSDAKKMMEKRQ